MLFRSSGPFYVLVNTGTFLYNSIITVTFFMCTTYHWSTSITYAQGTVFLFKEYFSIIEIVMNSW